MVIAEHQSPLRDSEFAREINIEAIPKTASVVPGTDNVLKVRKIYFIILI